MPPVGCFLYCDLMEPEALADLGIEASALQPARLPGWRLTFSPEPDIRPAAEHEVDGFLTMLRPAELDRLHAAKAAAGYLPVPIQVHTEDGAPVALSYASDRPPAAPEPTRLEAYLEACWRLGLPEGQRARVEAEAARLGAKKRPAVA